MAENLPKIYGAIVATMKDIGAVGKDQTNTFDKYKFRGIDDVYNALSPAMTKNGIFVVPKVLRMTQEDRASKNGGTQIHTVLDMEYTFYAVDGSNIVAQVVGEAMDRSDKSVNKAMSAAFKYACFQTFCIPTEEMKDADAESPEAGQKVARENTVGNRPNAPKGKDDMNAPLTEEQRLKIIQECDRTGNSVSIIEETKKKPLTELTRLEADSILRQLAKKTTKKRPAEPTLSEAEQAELPWNTVSISDL